MAHINSGLLTQNDPRAQHPPIYRLALYTPDHRRLIREYIFAVNPDQMNVTRGALTNVYFVAGSPQQGGTNAIADQYGMAPPLWTISGNTGWSDFRISYRGHIYAWNGWESMQQLMELIQTWANQNQRNRRNGTRMHILEFDDFFRNTFYEVVFSGPQEQLMTAALSKTARYALKLQGIRSLASPPGPPPDVIQRAFIMATGTKYSVIKALKGYEA